MPRRLTDHSALPSIRACRGLLGAALAAWLALAAPAVQAGVSASVTVSDLQWSLVDLDLADGLAPQATWADGSSTITGRLDAADGSAGPSFAQSAAVGFGVLGDQRSLPGAAVGAQTGPTLLGAWGRAGNGLGFDAAATTGHGLLGGGLVLGPGTGLRLSLRYALSASVDGRDSGCDPCDLAQAQLVVLLGLGQEVPLTAQRSVQAGAALERVDDQLEDVLTLDWDNSATVPQTLGVGLLLSASGTGISAVAVPVPEPGAALLLAGGLAALAGLRRRRR